MQIEPAVLQAGNVCHSVCCRRLSVCHNWTLVDLNKLFSGARMQRRWRQQGSVDAGSSNCRTHTHKDTHMYAHSASFTAAKAKSKATNVAPQFEIKEMFAPWRAEQSRAKEAAAKVMPGIFSSLAWIKLEYATQHKPEAKVQETNKQKAQEKAGCDGLEDTLGKPINKILILDYLQYFFGIFKIPHCCSTHNYVYN